jgi:hypothetical protein
MFFPLSKSFNEGLEAFKYTNQTPKRELSQLSVGVAFPSTSYWDSMVIERGSKGSYKRIERIMFNNTIAARSYVISLWYNPHKLETYNHILLEKLRKMNLISKSHHNCIHIIIVSMAL